MMSIRTWISLERESYRIWIPRTSSSYCHNNAVLVPPRKTTDPAKDISDGHNYNLKTRVDIWKRMDVFTVEYGKFAQTFHLEMWFFQFITGINFKLYYVLWHIIDLLVWIGLWTKFRIYRVLPDPVRWYCWGFGFLWRSLIMDRMPWTKNDLKVF